MNTFKIIKCSCKHEFQDSVYGNGMRLHNLGQGQKNSNTYKCTICKNKTTETSHATPKRT